MPALAKKRGSDMSAKKVEAEEVELVQPRLKELKVKNFRCIVKNNRGQVLKLELL